MTNDAEVNELFEDFDEEMKEISSNMSEQTKISCINLNVTFLLWICQGTYKTMLLIEDYIKEMDMSKVNDVEMRVSVQLFCLP